MSCHHSNIITQINKSISVNLIALIAFILTAALYPCLVYAGPPNSASSNSSGSFTCLDSGLIQYTYDDRYRMETVTYPNGDWVQYGYNDLDIVTSVTSSSGDMIAYDHYEDGSTKSISKNGLPEAEYTYTLDGELDTLTRPGNGTVTDYDYDGFGRTTRLEHRDGSGPFLAFDYTYDQGLRNSLMITSITRTESGVSETTSYDYDDMGRLKVTTLPDGSTKQYFYDNNGNILSVEERDSSGALLKSETYNYYPDTDPNHGKMNRVMSVEYDDDGDGITDRTRLFDYDLRGNVVMDDRGSEAFYYVYNSRNQITEVNKDTGSGPQWLASYEYDWVGRRIAAGREEFIYDVEDVLFTRFNGSINNEYVHGPGYDNVISSEDSGGTIKYPYTDHLGSVVGIDENGTRSFWQYDEWAKSS